METTPVKTATARVGVEQAGYRYCVLGVLAGIALLNTIDQSIVSVASPAIQTAFRLSDGQIGFLASAFVKDHHHEKPGAQSDEEAGGHVVDQESNPDADKNTGWDRYTGHTSGLFRLFWLCMHSWLLPK